MSPLALCDAGRTQLPKISQYVTVSESDHHRSPCVQSWHTRRHYCDDGGVINFRAVKDWCGCCERYLIGRVDQLVAIEVVGILFRCRIEWRMRIVASPISSVALTIASVVESPIPPRRCPRKHFVL